MSLVGKKDNVIASTSHQSLSMGFRSIFLATVVKVDEETYEVEFNIDGLPDFQGEHPKATPIHDTTRQILEKDKIFIFDLDPEIHTFKYLPIRSDAKTGIFNYKNYIDLTDEKIVKIKMGNLEITHDEEEKKTTIDLGNDSTITMKGTTTINCEKESKITIKGDSTLNCEKDSKITVKGAVNLNVEKALKIDCKDAIEIGFGMGKSFKINGVNTALNGFSVIPKCPYTGVDHCSAEVK